MSEKTKPQSETSKNHQSQKSDRATQILRWVSDTNKRIQSMEARISAIETNQNEMMATQNQIHQMLTELLQALQETENSEASELVDTVNTIDSRTERIEGQVSTASTGSSSGNGSG